MKKTLLFFVLFFLISCAESQMIQPGDYVAKKEFSYSIPDDEAFRKIKEWTAFHINAKDNPIIISDEKEGKIIAKGFSTHYVNYPFSLQTINYNYRMEAILKDGKAEIIFTPGTAVGYSEYYPSRKIAKEMRKKFVKMIGEIETILK